MSSNHMNHTYDFNEFIRKPNESNHRVACGSFGKVHHYHHSRLGEVAIKHIEISRENILERKRELQKIKNEAAVATRLRHKDIVLCYGTTKISDNCFGIVMEYVERGTLQDLIQQGKNDLPLFKRQSMLFELATALDYLHNYKEGKQIVHGDVKPQNILLTAEFSVKLADFGSVTFIKELNASVDTLDDVKSKQMTLFYAAPELLREAKQRYPSMDIYSFAMVAYEVLTMQEVYSNADRPHPVIIAAVLCGERPSSKPLDDVQEQLTGGDIQIFNVLREVTEKCWTDDPRLRPTAKQVCDLIEPKKTTKVVSFDKNSFVIHFGHFFIMLIVVYLIWNESVKNKVSTAFFSFLKILISGRKLIAIFISILVIKCIFDIDVFRYAWRNGHILETVTICIIYACCFLYICVVIADLDVANWKEEPYIYLKILASAVVVMRIVCNA